VYLRSHPEASRPRAGVKIRKALYPDPSSIQVSFGKNQDIPHRKTDYLSTLASSTLIILFSEMLKISKIISSRSKNIVKENIEY